MSGGGAKVVIGSDVKEAVVGIDSVGKAVQQSGKDVASGFQGWVVPAQQAEKATDSLYGKMKDLKGEAVQHQRVFKFYGTQLAELLPISKEVGAGMVGLVAGLGSGMWVMAAIEGVKLISAALHESGKEAQKAREEAEKYFEELWKEADKARDSFRFYGQSPSASLANEVNAKKDSIAQTRALIAAEADLQETQKQGLKEGALRYYDFEELNRQSRDRKASLERNMQSEIDALVPMEERLTSMLGQEALEGDKKTQDEKQKRRIEVAAEDVRLQREVLDEESRVWFDYYQVLAKYPELRAEAERVASMKVTALREAEEARTKKAEDQRIADQVDQDMLSGAYSGYEDTPRMSLKTDDTEKHAKKMLTLADAGRAVGESFSAIGNVIGGIGGKIASSIGSIVQLTLKFIGLAIAASEASAAETPVVGWIAAAGAGVAVAASLIGLLGSVGARADGGSILSGRPYLVGERGPELVVPGSSGTVIPNHALTGGSVHVTFNAPVDRAWWRANERHVIETIREASRGGRL